MIVVEFIATENRERRYSDLNVKIRQIETGNVYEDAVDIIPCPYTYEETNIPIETPLLDPQDALNTIFGDEN